MDQILNSLGSSNLSMMEQMQAIWSGLDDLSLEDPEKYKKFIAETLESGPGKKATPGDTKTTGLVKNKPFEQCLSDFVKTQENGSGPSTAAKTCGKLKNPAYNQKSTGCTSKTKTPANESLVEMEESASEKLAEIWTKNGKGDETMDENAGTTEPNNGKTLTELELPAHVGPTKVATKKGKKLLIEEIN